MILIGSVLLLMMLSHTTYAGHEDSLAINITITGPDTTAPDAISDLEAESTVPGKIKLTWTEPGDDGMTGTASLYDVRYSTTANIEDEGDFNGADAWSQNWQPGDGGSARTEIVTGLTQSVTYYWAIKAQDDEGLWSTWSRAGGVNSSNFAYVSTGNDPPNPFDLVSPSSGSIQTTATPTFDWNETTDPDMDSVVYDIWYSTVESFAVYDSSEDLTVSSFTPTVPLIENARYWWKVKAVDVWDAYTWSNQTRDLYINATNDPPLNFDLQEPSDEFVIDWFTNLVFVWGSTTDPDPNPADISYEVRYSSTSFATYQSSANLASTSYDVGGTEDTGLVENAGYDWVVIATDGVNYTWSSSTRTVWIDKSNELHGPFYQVYPSTDKVITTITPTFDWSDSYDPDPGAQMTYDLWYSTVSDYGVTDSSQGIEVSQYAVPSPLTDDKVYYWKVRAVSGGQSRWSTAGSGGLSFVVNTEENSPTPFDLLSPTNTVIVSTLTPTFTWEESQDPDPGDSVTYEVWYSTVSDFGVKESSAGIINTSFTPSSDLSEDTSYWWKVKATDSTSRYTWSNSTWSFGVNTSNTNPSAPEPVSPLDSSISSDSTPEFIWTESEDPDLGDSITYEFWYSTVSTFATRSTESVSGLSYEPSQPLTEDTTYWWKVRARDSVEAFSAWSDTWTVTINAENLAPQSFALVSPINNNIVYVSTPTFSWNESIDTDPGDVVNYTVRYTTYSDFTSYSSSEGIAVTNYVTPVLIENATYWWIVIATDGIDYTWSTSTESFRVNASSEPPGSFNLSLPENDDIVTIYTPTLDWEDAHDPDPDETVTYIVSYATSSDFAQPTESGDLDVSEYTTGVLTEDRKYWWKVKATGSDGLSITVGTYTFTVNTANNPPPVPELMKPDDLTTVSTSTPAFTWSESVDPEGDPVTYIVWYSTMQSFSTYTSSEGIKITTFTPTTALDENTRYWWRTAATDGPATSWSFPDRSFWVNATNEAPEAVELSSPTHQTLLFEIPELKWQASSDPDHGDSFAYRVEWSTVQSFDSDAVNYTTITATNYTPTSLDDDQRYWWRVWAYDVSGSSNPSTTWWFDTNLTNDAPQPFWITYPTGTISGMSVLPTFTWNEAEDPDLYDRLTYVVSYSISADFTPQEQSGQLSTNYFKPSTRLKYQTEYWWKVVVYDAAGSSATCSNVSQGRFTTMAVPMPTIEVVDIVDGLVRIARPYFRGTAPEGSEIKVYLKNLHSGEIRVLYQTVMTKSSKGLWEYQASEDLKDGDYEAWVEVTLDGTTSKSDSVAFRIWTPPEETKLWDPWPNPVKISDDTYITVRYDLKEPADMKLYVYNLAGELVKILDEGYLSANKYLVDWYGDNGDIGENTGKPVASGVYIIYFKADSYHETKKVILVR